MRYDFSKALYALEFEKEQGRERWCIGIINPYSDYLSPRSGEIVLFRKDPGGTITVSAPLSIEAILSKKHGLMTHWMTIINVPKDYVREVKEKEIPIYDRLIM